MKKVSLFSSCLGSTRRLPFEIMNRMQTVTEGKATLVDEDPEVFYNSIQQFNRDISAMSIKAWSKRYKRKQIQPYIKITEGLAATGLRSCRYALEIPNVKIVVANDLSEAAVKKIAENAKHNGVSEIVKPRRGDANEAIREERGHVIDLDPYGSAVPFLDSAVQAVYDGGILLVTCTDLAVLAGRNYPEKCFSHYGGTTLRNDSLHESALRLVLSAIASAAARYGRAIEPLMSLSIDYYLRCVVRVRSSRLLVKQNLGKSMIIYNCTGCAAFHPQPLGTVEPKLGYARGPVVGTHCESCGNPFQIAGPMWSGPLHSQEFLKDLLEVCSSEDSDTYQTKARIEGMTTLALQEIDSPFYVNPANLGSIVRSPSIPPLSSFMSALYNGGFEASLTHAQPGCVKTNAPFEFIWDLYRQWVKQSLDSGKEMKNSPGAKVLAKISSHEISFDYNEKYDAVAKLRKSSAVKFQANPRAEWGPQSKAKKQKSA